MTEVVVFVGAMGFLAVAAWRIWWKPAKLNAVVEVNQPTSVFVLVRHWSRHCYGIISPPMRSMSIDACSQQRWESFWGATPLRVSHFAIEMAQSLWYVPPSCRLQRR
jgi:hypothetical protein